MSEQNLMTGKNHLVISTGIKRMSVITDTGTDTGRSIEFNPTDQSFAEDLYGMVSKMAQIHSEKEKERAAMNDPVARFDINRAEDDEMRKAMDALFGNGFCGDVFKTRLFAVVDGLTVVEAFLYSLLDEMDASATESVAKRDARIRQYTDKYRKYAGK